MFWNFTDRIKEQGGFPKTKWTFYFLKKNEQCGCFLILSQNLMALSPQEPQGGLCKPPTPCLPLIPGDSGVCLKWSSRASGVAGCLTGDPLEPPGRPCTIRLHSCPISAQPGSLWPWDEGPQTRLLLEGLTWWGQLLCLRSSSRISPHRPPALGHFLPTPVNWCQLQKEWDCSPGLPGGRAHGPSLGEGAGVE